MQWFRDNRLGLAQRTMLLLVAVVSGSLVVLAAGFAMQRQDDFAEFSDARARAIAAQVYLTRQVLLSVPASYRLDVSKGLSSSGTVYAYPAGGVRAPAQIAAGRPSRPGFLNRLFSRAPSDAADLPEAIGRYSIQPAEVRFGIDGGPGYWVSQQIDGESWWIVVLAGRPPPAPQSVPWMAVAAVLLSLLGIAALFAATITSPLRKLAGAIHRIGDGLPEPVNVDGPPELRELVDGFNAMLLRLRQIESERQVLLGGLPHDLRAPLTRLRLRLAMLAELGEHPGIVDDIASIDRIVRQFTDYLRGVHPDEPSAPVDEVVRVAVEAHRSLGRDVHVEGEAVRATMAQHSLRRLVDNLIENAVQHGRAPVGVSIRHADAGFVELVVTDQGEGIEPAVMDMAMQPFTKLDPARGSGGCGLGLAIVRQLARQFGGSVRFEKRPNSFSVIVRLGVQ
jgi:signal transduction histidine kinase